MHRDRLSVTVNVFYYGLPTTVHHEGNISVDFVVRVRLLFYRISAELFLSVYVYARYSYANDIKGFLCD